MKIIIKGFLNTMTKMQSKVGLVFLPFHMLILPLLIGMLANYLPGGLDELTQTTIYYSIGLTFSLTVMWKFLRGAFDILLDNMIRSVTALLFGYILYLLLSYLAAGVLLTLLGDTVSNPNNQALLDAASESPRAVLGLAVFIAPLVEELLFRGVIFGGLRAKHRLLAFVVSIALFGIYHVWQYALMTMDWTLLVYAIQYIPAGYVLAWAYEKTDSIWVSIFLHMFINGASLMLIG